MNAVQTRQRRWSNRLNNNSQATIAAATSTNQSTHYNPYDASYPPMCYTDFSQTENRMIYEIPNVRLRPLPFNDLIEELIRPAGLISDRVTQRQNDSTLEFKLTVAQADALAMSPNTKQILIRFCHLDTTSEQDDNFPPDVTLLVNNQQVNLPPTITNPNKPNAPAKRPGQHVDITKLCKICPFVQNVINVKWFVDAHDPDRSYVIYVIIAEKMSSATLLQRIRERGLSDLESTKKLILDSDTEVATMNLQSSLLCPLGKMRMSMPCKSKYCNHIPCFDALVYLQMNEKKSSWICPICYKPAYYRDLMVDGFFMDILNNTELSVTEVKLNLDGTWNPVVKMEVPSSAKNPPPEVITISDDDDED